jgi:hypothetical protein
VVDRIVEHCPNLQYLELWGIDEFDVEVKEGMVRLLKNGLKKLVKFESEDVSIRLGTDWVGYPK